MASTCLEHAETIANLKYACGVLGAVVALLFYRLESARQQLYADAREDAKTDKEIADALKAVAAAHNNGSSATTHNPGGGV